MGPSGAGIIGNATTTAGMMGNAALASLGSQAAISLINNKGDVGKTLKELGSSQTAKATIAAALTAGVLDKLGNANGMGEIKTSIKNGTAGFSEKLTYNLINASGRALTNTAINGGNLEDALKQALIGGLVDTAHGQAASKTTLLISKNRALSPKRMRLTWADLIASPNHHGWAPNMAARAQRSSSLT
jgi:filamentous hemagglutinin